MTSLKILLNITLISNRLCCKGNIKKCISHCTYICICKFYIRVNIRYKTGHIQQFRNNIMCSWERREWPLCLCMGGVKISVSTGTDCAYCVVKDFFQLHWFFFRNISFNRFFFLYRHPSCLKSPSAILH